MAHRSAQCVTRDSCRVTDLQQQTLRPVHPLIFVILLLSLVAGSVAAHPAPVSAAPTYWLPWQKGSIWRITRGNLQGEHARDSTKQNNNAANWYGWDAVVYKGSDLVTAVADGTVYWYQNSIPATALFKGGHAGNCIMIKHADGQTSLYAHLAPGSIPNFRIGQPISHGTVIGRMGDTGFAIGKHLHWSVGTNPRHYVGYGYETCAEDTAQSRYADPDPDLQAAGGIPQGPDRINADGSASGFHYYESFNEPGAQVCSEGARPIVTSQPTVTPSNPTIGQDVTATYTMRNDGCADFTPAIIGLGGRGPGGDSDIQDIWDWSKPVIKPGQSWTFSATRSFDHAGQFNFGAGWVDGQGNWHEIPAASGVSRNVSITVTDSRAIPHVITSLAVSPKDPMVGDAVTATFQLRNDGNADFKPNLIGVAARGPGEVNEDVSWQQNVVVQPGQTWTYTAARRFTSPGDRTFFISYRDDAGAWRGIDPVSGVSTGAALTVQACAPRPVLTASLAISPAQPHVGDEVTATYKVTNTGCADFSPKTIGVGGRGPGGASDIQDFNFYSDVVIKANEEYNYTATRTFDTAGTYGFDTSYRTPDDHWIRIPVTDGSVKNMTTLTVLPRVNTPTPAPTAAPSSTIAPTLAPTAAPTSVMIQPIESGADAASTPTSIPTQAVTATAVALPTQIATDGAAAAAPAESDTAGSPDESASQPPVADQSGDTEADMPFAGGPLAIRASAATSEGAASQANDGDQTTIWSPAVSSATLTFDLGRPTRLTGVRWMYGSGGSDDALVIETGTSGRTWSPAGSFSGGDGGSWYTQPLDGPARYVRFTLTNPDGVRGNIAEVEVWGGNGTRQSPPAAKRATASQAAATASQAPTAAAAAQATPAADVPMATAPALSVATTPPTAAATATDEPASDASTGTMIVPAGGSTVVEETGAGPTTSPDQKQGNAPTEPEGKPTDNGQTVVSIGPATASDTTDMDETNGSAPEVAASQPADGTRMLTVTPVAAGSVRLDASLATPEPIPAAVPADMLSAGGPNGQVIYLTYDVQGIAPGTVVTAALVLTGAGPAAPSGDVLAINGAGFDPADQAGIEPASLDARQVSGVPAVAPGQAARVDVTAVVASDGTVTFLLPGPTDRTLTIAGPQSPAPPRLEITVRDQ